MIVKQSSKGDYSPNIDVTGTIEGDLKIEITGKSTTGSEFTAIARVIEELSVLSADAVDGNEDEFIKDPAAKLVKYTELSPYFEDDYVKLGALYSNTYRQAWLASGITELQKFGIATHLSYWSRTMLETYNDNPVQAFHALVSETASLVGNNSTQFDLNAVRYFLYQEFANCNIFSFKALDE